MTERMARCDRCGGKDVPSRIAKEPNSPYAFFTDLSAGTQDHVCRVCGYHKVAHELWEGIGQGVNLGKWPAHVSRHDFEPLTEGREFDRYYCGCGGWD